MGVNIFTKTRLGIGKFFLGNSAGSLASWFNWVMPGNWSRTDLLKQYERYVYTIVSAIAEDFAKMDLKAYRMSKGAKLPVDNSEFLRLLKKPNPDTSQFQFLEMHAVFMKLAGESFWYIPKTKTSKKPGEMYLLRPDLMEVAVDTSDKKGLVTGYALVKNDGKKTTFEKDEIVHFKTPNPLNPYRGLGTVQASQVYIQTEQSSAEWTRNSVLNSGRPSGIVNLKGVITDEQFKQFKRQFKSEYSGVENAGKTLLTRGADGIDFQKLGMELNGVALKELKELTRDDIMVMFRVSKTILGITDDVNRANARESRIVFRENVVKPEMDRFIDHLNAFVVEKFSKEGEFVEYDDPATISEEEKVKEWEVGHNKWLTTNDIRAEKGLDPLPGGDVIYQPLSLVPQDATSLSDSDGEKSLKKKEHNHKVTKAERDEKRKERGEVFRQLLFENQARWEKKYKAEVNKEFEIQRKEILANNKGKRLTPKRKELDNWLFDLNASKERLIAVLFPLAIEIMRDQAQYAFDMADNPDAELEINDRVREYVNDRINKLADETNDLTVTEIIDTISDGILNGDSLAELRNRINAVYDNATKVRSERIARTETIAVSNESANEAYRQSPLVKYKEWHVEPDACEFCKAMDGVIVGLDTNFVENGGAITGVDGGTYSVNYLAIDHPPLHPNCRCAILPVIDN